MQKTFNPKPGDTIVCDFANYTCISKADLQKKYCCPIDQTCDFYGYNESTGGYAYWNLNGNHANSNDPDFIIRKIIPANPESTPKKTPHIHAELIKAWADGAEIEILHESGWCKCISPAWHEDTQYRIKPEVQPDIVFYAYADTISVGGYFKEQKPPRMIEGELNLRLTFDGETGKLKAAEVLEN